MKGADFLLQALVYLGAAVLFVPLFKRLGLGSVLGYLIAGMAIGPWGLELIADAEAVRAFSEFGVVLLLFILGLELEPRRLWSLRGAIFGLGGLQVVLTTALVAAIARHFGQSWTYALVVGMAASMSSTAIAIQVLAERNLVAARPGQSAFAVSLLQDLAVIPLLLVLGLVATATAGGAGPEIDWLAAARAVLVLAVMVIAGRLLLRPALRAIAATGLRETFVALALLLVMGSAWITSSVGLSLALGSFIAGVLLADSEYRIELEVDIEPFKGLLLGLFFISVGMEIDLGLFAAQPLEVLAMAAIAVLAKLVVLRAVARLGQLRGADAWTFALSIAQVGEFAFVLLAVAAGQALLDRSEAAALNAAVALSMLGTPLLFVVRDRWQTRGATRAAGRRADHVEEQRPVIIAGFGRFGQVVARMLIARRIAVTVIDHDPDQIELVRRFGWRAYYGDVRRPDVLEAAGVAGARLLVLAIDDPVTALATLRHALRRYPGLRVVVRTRGRTDAFEVDAMGMPFVRETFGSALRAGELALQALGESAPSARRAAELFRAHDEALLRQSTHHRHDREKLIAITQQGRRDLEALLREEIEAESKADDQAGDGLPPDDAGEPGSGRSPGERGRGTAGNDPDSRSVGGSSGGGGGRA
ncbi:MAG: cation:proton antiporter [Burkholderiales bacterium]|nr:MAG: cation:proton antiporter [Burkholderiales bacterium]